MAKSSEDDDPLLAIFTPKERLQMEIMERVNAKYVRTYRDRRFEARLRGLIRRAVSRAVPGVPISTGIRPEQRAVIVIGLSGAGKSTSLYKIFSTHPAFPDYCQPGCALITIRVDDPCTLKSLGTTIMEELGYPLTANREAHVIWAMVRDRLHRLKVRFVHFDEIQNLTNTANRRELEDTRDMLKNLMNDRRHPIGLILSGLPEIETFIQSDRQLERRSNFINFRPLTTADLPRLHGILVSYAETGGLTVESNALTTVIPRLLHAAKYEMGIAIEMIREAITLALETRVSVVTGTEFAAHYANLTDRSAADNPFVAPNWADINCDVVVERRKSRSDRDDDDPGKGRKPRRHAIIRRGDF